MKIRIDNSEFLSLMHVEVDTEKLSEILRKKLCEELSRVICDNTKSYITAERLLGSDCIINIRDNEKIVVILRDGEKEREFIIFNHPLLYLLYSVYYMSNINNAAQDDRLIVEYGAGWDDKEKEKEAE